MKGVATDSDKTAKVATWLTPSNKREVQQFLGFANYYRRFIRDFFQVARPLHWLTEQTTPFQCTRDCQESFNHLRKRLCSTPVFAFPNFNEPFILDTDASDVGIGGVLSQLNSEGKERVESYGSRLLTKPERQYCVTRRELLAVVTFVQQYQPYLLGRKFTLRTDHGSLTWLRNFIEPEGQLARWLERLQEFEFDIVHRPGKAHGNADALSRLPCHQCGQDNHNSLDKTAEVAVTALELPEPHTNESLRQLQLADKVVGPLLQCMNHSEEINNTSAKQAIQLHHRIEANTQIEPTPTSKAAKRLLQLRDQMVLCGGVSGQALQTNRGLEDSNPAAWLSQHL